MRACPKCLHSFIRINTHFTRFPSHDPNNFAERSDDDDDNDEEAPSSINEQNALSSRRLPGTILGASHRRRSPETNGDSTFPLLDFPVQEEDVNSESTYPADAATHQHGEAPIVSTQSFSFTIEEHQTRIAVSPWDRSMAELYLVADKAGAHRDLVDDLLGVMRREKRLRRFDPMHAAVTKRDAYLNRVKMSPSLRPSEKVTINLDLGFSIDIFRFPLQESLQDLMLGPLYVDSNNLSIPPERIDPWDDSPVLQGPPLSLFNGTWYRETHADLYSQIPAEQRSLHILESLIFYIDRTGVDGRQKNGLEPLTASLGSLTTSAREKRDAWVTLGFVPNLDEINSQVKRTSKKRNVPPGILFKVYHQCIEALLLPLVQLQKEPPLMLHRRGNKAAKLFTHFKAVGVSCDGKAADYLAAKVMDKGPTTPRLSRRCLTNHEASDDPSHRCCLVDGRWIDRIVSGALGCTYREDSSNLAL
jgi:hypothetical protein